MISKDTKRETQENIIKAFSRFRLITNYKLVRLHRNLTHFTARFFCSLLESSPLVTLRLDKGTLCG